MSGKGRRVTFHGAFARKADAVKKERRTLAAFVEERRIKGKVRYVVMTQRR